MPSPTIENKAAPGISYFTPAQEPPAGSAAIPQSDGTQPPKLFRPFTVRGKTFHNRIGVSYSAPGYYPCLVLVANCKSSSYPHYANTAPTMDI